MTDGMLLSFESLSLQREKGEFHPQKSKHYLVVRSHKDGIEVFGDFGEKVVTLKPGDAIVYRRGAVVRVHRGPAFYNNDSVRRFLAERRIQQSLLRYEWNFVPIKTTLAFANPTEGRVAVLGDHHFSRFLAEWRTQLGTLYQEDTRAAYLIGGEAMAVWKAERYGHYRDRYYYNLIRIFVRHETDKKRVVRWLKEVIPPKS